MSWTPEREKCLKEMWLSGEYSAQQIADKLGNNVTRNAVIGKANRLQLSKLADSVSAIKPKVGRRSTKANLGENEKIASNAFTKKAKVRSTVNNKDKSLTEPKPLNLNLLELTDSTCKWPVNEEMVKEYCFCGITTNSKSPYCEYHANKAFHNLRNKSRKSA